jgi:hypothetical protein
MSPCRRYGSVEKLAKQLYGEHYIPVAPDWEFKQLFLDGFAQAATSSVPSHNAFDAVRAHSILTIQEKLWPIVYLNTVRIISPHETERRVLSDQLCFLQIGTFLVAVPLIEGVISHTPEFSSDFGSIESYKQLPLIDMYESLHLQQIVRSPPVLPLLES